MTIPVGGNGAGAVRKVRTKVVVSSAQVKAAIVSLDVGSVVRVVYDTAEVLCPENAIAGIPWPCAAHAAPLFNKGIGEIVHRSRGIGTTYTVPEPSTVNPVLAEIQWVN